MIDEYSFGQIVVDGVRYTQDVIIYPDGRVDHSWWREEGHALNYKDIAELVGSAPQWIIVGTGEEGQLKIDPALDGELAEIGIEMEALPTYEAVQLFNDLSKTRSVGACIHLTC